MNQELISITGEDCRRSCIDPLSLSALSNQSLLITGGTGFIGKWLTEMIVYLNKEHHFNCKLYLLARDIERFKKEVPHLAKGPYINLIEQDIRNLHDIPQDVSWVIHAAGSPDNREHVSQPLRTIDTFYKGTNTLFDACFRLPDLKKLLHISSHQVYGQNVTQNTIKENQIGISECNSVNAAYPEAKRMAETLCAIYRNQQKLPITIVRPFAFIGPYQNTDKPWAINNFIRDGLLGGPIRILGNAETIRSYLYGSDIAYWLLQMLVNGKSGSTYNLGSSESVSLKQLASTIANLINGKIEVIYKSSKEVYNFVSIAVPDISKSTTELGVKEIFNLNTALERTIQWNTIHTNSHY